jgi:hypothetical protein
MSQYQPKDDIRRTASTMTKRKEKQEKNNSRQSTTQQPHIFIAYLAICNS